MDDINGLAQIFGNGYFPMIICAVLIIGIYKLLQYHKEEIDKLTQVINRNTEVMNGMNTTIQQLSDRLEALESKRGDKDE